MTIKTTIKCWSLVTIKDDENHIKPFKVLWAIVEHDNRGRFKKDDYICSSRILSIKDNLATTQSGTTYELIGPGAEYTASYAQLMLLIDGLSPAELNLKVECH